MDESLVLRWFYQLYWRETSEDTTLIRWTHTLPPETQHRLVDRTVELVRQARMTQGHKLRLDGTEISHPADSVRKLSQLVTQAREVLVAQGAKVQQCCRSRLHTARRKSKDKEAAQKKL